MRQDLQSQRSEVPYFGGGGYLYTIGKRGQRMLTTVTTFLEWVTCVLPLLRSTSPYEVMCSLQQGAVAPNLHFNVLNPHIDLNNSCLDIPTVVSWLQMGEWERGSWLHEDVCFLQVQVWRFLHYCRHCICIMIYQDLSLYIQNHPKYVSHQDHL